MKTSLHISAQALPALPGAGLSAADIREIKTILMRKLAYILLVAYTLVVIKPILPIAVDALSHTFWKGQHMAVHEINGKFHLHTELANAAKQTEKEKHTTSSKIDIHECVQVHATPLEYAPKSYPAIPNLYNIYQCYYAQAHTCINYPPPKFLLTSNSNNVPESFLVI